MGIPVLDVATVAVGVMVFTHQFIPPIRRTAEYATNRLMPNQVPTIADAIELRKRDIISKEMYEEYLLIQGWDLPQSRNFWKAAEVQLSADAILQLYWREEINNKEYKEKMSELGYTEDNAELFDKSRQFYPNPNDLVLWQAKEVFEPDAVKKYGLDNEFELINKEAFYKAGMNDEQIRNYWRAHWQHPSLSMIYELLHRGELDEEDVYEYFRLVEIPPYWREKLIKISHPPYTRVDTRRMYEAGVLSREEVKRNYLDLGYDEEKAENMTVFTIGYSAKADRDLTRTQIEKAFEYGIIKDKEAVTMFKDIGYAENESIFILGLKTYKMAQDEIDDKIATIKTRFRRGLITQEQALTDLDKMEISATYRDKIIAEILREKTAEFALPSKTDLVGWYQNEMIDKEKFVAYMERLGFQEAEIALYLESYKP